MPYGLRRSSVLAASALTCAVVLLTSCSKARETHPGEASAGIRAMLDGVPAPVLSMESDTVRVSEPTVAFYASRGFQPAWTDGNGLLPQGEALASVFREASSDGLEPAHYHEDAVQSLIARVDAEHEEDGTVEAELGSLDVLLTEAYLRYADDLTGGTVDPDSAGVEWLIPDPDSANANLLTELLQRSDPKQALEELRPTVPFYDELRAALPRYQKIADEGGWPTVSEGERLKVGVSDPRVLELRRRLVVEGDPAEAPLVAGAAASATYDSALAEAVTHFQRRHGIEPDGTVGRETLTALNVPVEDRVLTLRLNLDRWRWLPRELGERYVLVNVPGFELAVMENHRPVLDMNVVVGKEGWNTPVFQDTLESIVVNPYWNVPPSIAERDLLDKSPDYLVRNGFEVVNRSGKPVSPENVGAEGYTIRQKPGGKNALGNVKFVFPNSMNIYLHDTPARHLFQRTRRMESHGCIRIEKPRELAEYLIATSTSKPAGTYDELLESGREQWVNLEKKVPIYILYFTAWADDQGSVSFFPDVYDRDRALGREARAKLGQPSSAEVATALTVPEPGSSRR